jgi:predicted small secreted protein
VTALIYTLKVPVRELPDLIIRGYLIKTREVNVFIYTTVNLDLSLLQELSATAGRIKISKSELVSRLIIMFMKKNNMKIRMFQRVIYQERKLESSWHRLHINIKPQVYEYCLDLRKLYKMSVSNIIAYALKNFLFGVEADIKTGRTDNYCLSYVFYLNVNNDVFSFTLFWDLPDKKLGSLFNNESVIIERR